MTSQRAFIMDVPYIFLVSPFALMIPMPRPSTDAGGFWKPFQPNVIIYILVKSNMSLLMLYIYFIAGLVGFIGFSPRYRPLFLVDDEISIQSENTQFGKHLQYDARNVSKTLLYGPLHRYSLTLTT